MFASKLVSFARFAAVASAFVTLQACGPATVTLSSKYEPNAPPAGIAASRGASSSHDPVERLPFDRVERATVRAEPRDYSRARFEVDCKRCNR
ncbi:MAG: hypothetical protein KF819_40050 [Labilithrix sp.]|nr:hypothetical protein [Labilithrix sp.]